MLPSFLPLSFIYSFRRYAKGWIKLNHSFFVWRESLTFPPLFSSVAAEEYLKSKHSNLSLTAWKGEYDRIICLYPLPFFIVWQRMWPFRWLCGVNMKKFSSHIYTINNFQKGRTAKIYASQKNSNKWQQNELWSVK